MANAALLLNLVLDGLAAGCVYGLLAIGFSLLWWIAGVVHLAHGGILLAAGFSLYTFLSLLGLHPSIAAILALLATVASGLLIEVGIYRPLLARHTDEMGMLTASLGVLIVIEYVLTIAYGPEGVSLEPGNLRRAIAPGSGVAFDYYSAIIIAVTVAVFIGLSFFLRHSQLGREMRAVATNPELARTFGVSTGVVYTATAAIAAALALPAGTFLLFNTGITPHEALHLVLVASVVAIIGGRGSVLGALVAGVMIGIAESTMTFAFAAGWRQLVTFVILYALLMLRPQGLFRAAA